MLPKNWTFENKRMAISNLIVKYLNHGEARFIATCQKLPKKMKSNLNRTGYSSLGVVLSFALLNVHVTEFSV